MVQVGMGVVVGVGVGCQGEDEVWGGQDSSAFACFFFG